jgi:hypothetical protein
MVAARKNSCVGMGVSPDDHGLCLKAEPLERPRSLAARRHHLAPHNRIAFLAGEGPRTKAG